MLKEVSLIDFLVNITFFACLLLSLTSIKLGFIDLYYYYAFILITFPILIIVYKKIDFWIAIVSIYLLFTGLLNVFFNNNDFLIFFKVYIGLFSFYYFFNLIIIHNKYNLDKLFDQYYRICIFNAYIGIFQFLSFLIGFTYGYNYSWFGVRVMVPSDLAGLYLYPVHSILSEPSFFVLVQSGSIYLALLRLFKSDKFNASNRFNAFLIFLTLFLSQSSTGYFALFISLILIFWNNFNFKRAVLAFLTIPSSFFIIYFFVPKFQERLDSLIRLVAGNAISGITNIAGSSFILYNHFVIAIKNANDHFFGTGVGSHHVAFQKYNDLYIWFTGYGPNGILLNLHDASSLFNRILSEMGYFGIILLFLFLIQNFIKIDSRMKKINHASLVFILTALLRSGHYFLCGLPLFVLAYYYSKRMDIGI